MAVRYFKNPIILAVLICILFFYSGFFKIGSKHPFVSLLPQSQVTGLSGQLRSSPAKVSGKDLYSADFLVDGAEGLVAVWESGESGESGKQSGRTFTTLAEAQAAGRNFTTLAEAPATGRNLTDRAEAPAAGRNSTAWAEAQAAGRNLTDRAVAQAAPAAAPAHSAARGLVKVYIPSNMAEAFFPGKLYSSAKRQGAFLYETGGFYIFSGRFRKNGAFYVESCKAASWPQGLLGRADYFRALCRLHFKRLMYSWGAGGGLLLALLCGAREYTEEATSMAFRQAGLSHILALSGMHLSMFSAIALFFGKKIGRKKLTFIIRVVALLIFVWFAGLSPSLLRAFICAILTIMASATGTKEPDKIFILAFSFFIQMIISPGDIYNLGFMLSYGALAGILIFSAFFRRLLNKILPLGLSASLSSSTGAQIFTAPISLATFGTFAPIGILATSVVSPFVTIFIYSGLCLIILSMIFPFLQVPSGYFIKIQYNVIKFIVQIFAMAPAIGI